MDEKIIEIGGKEYILSPTFANLKKLELRTKERFMKTASRLASQDFGPDDIATIVYCLMDVESKDKPNYDDFAQAVFEQGFMSVCAVCTEIFTEIITAGGKDSKKQKEAASL